MQTPTLVKAAVVGLLVHVLVGSLLVVGQDDVSEPVAAEGQNYIPPDDVAEIAAVRQYSSVSLTPRRMWEVSGALNGAICMITKLFLFDFLS